MGPIERRGHEAAGPWNRLTVGFAALFGVTALVLAVVLLRPDPPDPPAQIAAFPTPFLESQLPTGRMRFTPDGSAIIYVGPGSSGTGSQLWLRRWDDLVATPIRGTEALAGMTFELSPDGTEIAFTELDALTPLRAVPLTGGPARTMVEDVTSIFDWGSDGFVYVNFGATPNARMGRAAAAGTAADSIEALPDGEPIHGLAAPIDPAAGALTGPAVPLVEGLSVRPPFGTMDYALSEQGTLVYSLGAAPAGSGTGELVWVDRSGSATPTDPGWSYNPAAGGGYGWELSPDGTRVATTREIEGVLDIWIKQLPDGPFDRLTLTEEQDRFPTWTPDGAAVTYSREAGVLAELWLRNADGTGEPTRLLAQEGLSMVQSVWSPDGQWLVFANEGPAVSENQANILGFRPGVDSVAVPLIANPSFDESQPAISPDGRWVAYLSDESGRAEIYVRPFPDVDSGRVRVSTEGGREPLWSRDGSELFFVDGQDNLVAADVDGASEFRVTNRRILFPIGIEYGIGSGSAFIDISLDDERFLMGRLAGSGEVLVDGGPRFVLVQNFFERLREVTPE